MQLCHIARCLLFLDLRRTDVFLYSGIHSDLAQCAAKLLATFINMHVYLCSRSVSLRWPMYDLPQRPQTCPANHAAGLPSCRSAPPPLPAALLFRPAFLRDTQTHGTAPLLRIVGILPPCFAFRHPQGGILSHT